MSLVLGVADALLRNAEMPAVPAPDMRLMLKYNAEGVLQQDFPEYAFDCQTLGFVQPVPGAPGDTATIAKTPTKARVLVGAAKQQTLDQLNAAATSAN